MKPEPLSEVCREHRLRRLGGAEGVVPADAQGDAHEADCPACRAWRELHDALLREGERARGRDVSEFTIAATRGRAAAILAGRARVATAAHGFHWRRASAGLAAAALLAVLGVSVLRGPAPEPVGPDSGGLPLGGAVEAAADLEGLDREIDGLREDIGRRMAQANPVNRRSSPVFDSRSTHVQWRIDRCAVAIGRELQATAALSERKDP